MCDLVVWQAHANRFSLQHEILAKYSGMTIKSWTTRVLDGVVQEHEQKIKGELAKQP